MKLFNELCLSQSTQANLKRHCFSEPTPVQAQAIPPALTGADLIATAQTGTGKTLAFLLPVIEKLLIGSGAEPKVGHGARIRALVLSPTRELAMQISDAFTKLSLNTGLRAAVAVGGLSEQTQLNAIRRGAQLVIATPGRLEDFLDRELVKLNAIEMLVLDEADRMLDMGFLPAIERILSTLPTARQSLFFSATIKKDVERLIARYSKDPIHISVNGSKMTTPDQIDLHLYEVEDHVKLALLRHMLGQNDGSFLVFARTKHGTDRLAKRLSGLGLPAVAMHGDRTQNQRNQALKGFRDGRYRILVATDVAARGIHIDGVAHVVNYDLPQAPTDFIHRVGRTGRAGQRGAASTFSRKSERGEVRRIEQECKVLIERRKVAGEIVQEANELVRVKTHGDSAAPNNHFHRSFPGDRHGRQDGAKRQKRGHRSR
jgi:ATP-dependent RNA helicase RhlE